MNERQKVAKEIFDELERRIDFDGDTSARWYKPDIEKMKAKYLEDE